MSIIQKIQEKYAKLMAVIIAVALIIFVIMLAFENGGSLFSGRDTTVGKVNGTSIDYQEFSQMVARTEKMQQSRGMNISDANRQQIIQSVWDQQLSDAVLQEQYEKLGLTVSDKELRDILYGANPPQDLAQNFTDPQTGQYNPAQVQQYISTVRKQGSLEEQQQMNDYIEALEKDRLQEKYVSMLMNTINFPKWFIEKRNVENSLIATAAFVNIPYASIPDSTVKISDKDIQDYINDNKKDFEQKEEMRNIEYVSFSAAPSAADSVAARNAVAQLIPQFDSVSTDMEGFIRKNSVLPFYNGFISRSQIQQVNKDSILSAPVGVVYGPYLDPGTPANYTVSKILASRSIPDTVKVRHVLVATHQMTQTGDRIPVREEAEARRIIDSVMAAHKAGANFDTLVVRHSDDPGSKDKGGVYEGVTTGRMVPTFNDFIFTNPRGATGVVQTDYGFHYIEVLEQKGSSQGFKIAYLAKPIQASQETDNAAATAASTFAADSRSHKAFTDNYEKNLKGTGVNKFPATNIRSMDFSIAGMEAPSRKLIRDIFNADKGDVIGPERVGESYIVAVVTEVNEAGLASVAQVRPMIEPILRNKKKAQMLTQQIGTVNSLEELATKYNVMVQPLDSIRFSGGNNMLAYEPKVIGAIFNPENKGKITKPIGGQAGVYVVRVDNTSTTPVEAASVEEQRNNLVMQTRQNFMSQMQYGGNNPYVEVLKRNADIKDNRSDFY